MVMHARLLVLLVGSIALACDPQGGDRLDDTPATDDDDGERGLSGKADAPGSCQPDDCGGKASVGSCWCDELCDGYGDCCVDKEPVCDGAAPSVSPPPDLPLPPGTLGSVLAPPNLDDDDGTHTDWQQYPFANDDDLTTLALPASVTTDLNAGDWVRLELSGATSSIRVWHDGQPRLGSAAGTNTYDFVPAAGDVLQVEFGAYASAGVLTVERRNAAGSLLSSEEVVVHSAPLVMNHHLQPSEQVFAVRVQSPGYNNNALIAAYANVLGSQFTQVPGSSYGSDVWVQDEFEFATATGPGGQRLDVVIDSIRDRGLDRYAEDQLVGPGVIAETWGTPSQATTFDSFGNLEASPPVTVNGVEYPFGRIYYGRQGNWGLNSQLRSFLASQSVQAPFEVDTTWLCVGHVDEISSFVPDPSSPKGFRLLLADVDAGIDVLQSLPAGFSLPRYAADHGYGSVGQILGDNALMALNAEIQADYLDGIRQLFKARLGLTDADIIEVPSLFEHLSGCGAAALVPGMVNLIVADQGAETHVFMADPFFRADLFDQNDDPFIEAVVDQMPADLNLHFVDDWDVYHLGVGEVHCGTNVIRTPTASWWTNSAHLLGGL